MDQASASSAASCARNPVAPRTSSSCSRSADRSQTGVPLPARSGPQSEPHAEPSNRDPSPSSPPSANSRLRAISCRSFTPAQPHNPAASLRDYCSGAYIERSEELPAGYADLGAPRDAMLAPDVGERRGLATVLSKQTERRIENEIEIERRNRRIAVVLRSGDHHRSR